MRSPLSFVSTTFLVSSALYPLVSGNPVFYRREYGGFNYTECPSNTDNPFADRVGFANPVYAKKLGETVDSFLALHDHLDADRTKTVQKTSTFIWVTSTAGVTNFSTRIEEAKEVQRDSYEKLIVPFVIYNLPNRDCSAGASAGELTAGRNGLENYKKFIDSIVEIMKPCDDLDFAVVLEPDAVGNLVTNLNSTGCKQTEDVYIEGIAYAVKALQSTKAAIYIDIAHANWLGWPNNLEPAAKVLKKIMEKAGPNAKIRGFSTNVSNYNPYYVSAPPPYYGSGPINPNYSELRYIKALAPHLRDRGLPVHFIVDQGRSGVPDARSDMNHWCNIKGAGFGVRPTTKTGDCSVDSIVWVKPGGESDGSSDRNSTRFAEDCASNNAFIPSPDPGKWSNAYVMDLVRNANPPLPTSI